MSGIIYIITTGDEGYVGSTNNFKKRILQHKSNIYNKNSKDYNYKVYKKIRENNGEWDMCIYEDNLSLNKKELCIYEEKVRLLLGATLNCRRAFRTEQQKQEYIVIQQKKTKERNEVSIKCECGCEITKSGLSTHKKSAKHKKLMV